MDHCLGYQECSARSNSSGDRQPKSSHIDLGGRRPHFFVVFLRPVFLYFAIEVAARDQQPKAFEGSGLDSISRQSDPVAATGCHSAGVPASCIDAQRSKLPPSFKGCQGLFVLEPAYDIQATATCRQVGRRMVKHYDRVECGTVLPHYCSTGIRLGVGICRCLHAGCSNCVNARSKGSMLFSIWRSQMRNCNACFNQTHDEVG